MQLESYYVSLSKGDSATIKVANIPDGYSENDLVWTTSDSSILSVSKGVVTAKDSGSAVVTVSTSDGIYKCSANVNILGDEVEFTPLDDELLYAS